MPNVEDFHSVAVFQCVVENSILAANDFTQRSAGSSGIIWPYEWETSQDSYMVENFLTDSFGSRRIIPSDEVANFLQIRYRRIRPVDTQLHLVIQEANVCFTAS